MLCPKCCNYIPDGYEVCPDCGAIIAEVKKEQENKTVPKAPTGVQYTPPQAPSTKEDGWREKMRAQSGNEVSCRGCIVLAWIALLFNFILGVWALIDAYSARRSNEEYDYDAAERKKNRSVIVSIIAIIVGVIAIVGIAGGGKASSRYDAPSYYSTSADSSSRSSASTGSSSSRLSSSNPNFVNKDYRKGVVTASGYESEYIGLAFKPGTDWTFLSEEELEMTDKLGDALEGVLANEESSATTGESNFTEMIAKKGTDDVNINVKKLTSIAYAMYGVMDVYGNMAESYEEEMAAWGIQVVSAKAEERMIDGQKQDVFVTSYIVNGKQKYQMQFYVLCGDMDHPYCAYITIGSDREDRMEEIMDAFSWIS